MTAAKDLARLLVLQKSILDVLKDADAETREQAKALFENGDAAAAIVDGTTFGRVRRDQPRQEFRVVDWPAFEKWVQDKLPDYWVNKPHADPELMRRVKRDGAYINRDTGEILEPDGVELVESPGNLVVTTTDAATEWAQEMVGRTIRGELE